MPICNGVVSGVTPCVIGVFKSTPLWTKLKNEPTAVWQEIINTGKAKLVAEEAVFFHFQAFSESLNQQQRQEFKDCVSPDGTCCP